MQGHSLRLQNGMHLHLQQRVSRNQPNRMRHATLRLLGGTWGITRRCDTTAVVRRVPRPRHGCTVTSGCIRYQSLAFVARRRAEGAGGEAWRDSLGKAGEHDSSSDGGKEAPAAGEPPEAARPAAGRRQFVNQSSDEQRARDMLGWAIKWSGDKASRDGRWKWKWGAALLPAAQIVASSAIPNCTVNWPHGSPRRTSCYLLFSMSSGVD